MPHTLSRLVLPLVALLGTYAQVAGQRQPPPDWRTSPTLGFGYVGNGPRALLGANAYLMLPATGGLGLYADFKFTPEDYGSSELVVSGVTREQAEVEFQDVYETENERWYVLNLALVRPITPQLALYLGAGYAHETSYRDYFDPSRTRGVAGQYRIEDQTSSGSRANAVGGALFRAGRHIAFHLGAESAPAGFDAGVSLLFPLR